MEKYMVYRGYLFCDGARVGMVAGETRSKGRPPEKVKAELARPATEEEVAAALPIGQRRQREASPVSLVDTSVETVDA